MRRAFTLWAAGLACLSPSARADYPPPDCPPPPCLRPAVPPAYPPAPSPAPPSAPPAAGAPATPPGGAPGAAAPPAAAPNLFDAGAAASAAAPAFGGEAGAATAGGDVALATSTLGDLFGSRALTVAVVVPGQPPQTITVSGPINGHYSLTGTPVALFPSAPQPTFLGQPVGGAGTFFAVGPGFGTTTGGPLAAASPGQTAIQQIIQAAFGAGGTFTFLPAANQATTTNSGTTFDLAVGYDYTLPGTAGA